MKKVTSKNFLVVCVLCAVFFFTINKEVMSENTVGNLMPNPGFEEIGEKDLPKAWSIGKNSIEGEVELVSDIVHSGEKAAKINVKTYIPKEKGYGSASWQSDFFESPPANTKLKVSVWVKANNVIAGEVGFYKLRFTVYAFDETKNKKIQHWDIVTIDGTFDWKKVEGEIVIPEGTKYLKVGNNLTACTGTAFFDDIEILVSEDAINMQNLFKNIPVQTSYEPVINPKPWQVEYTGKAFTFKEVGVYIEKNDLLLQEEMNIFLKDANISGKFITEKENNDNFNTLVLIGNTENTEIKKFLPQFKFKEKLKDLGEQGYCLKIVNGEKQNIVVIGANSKKGMLYGVQTLKQLIDKDTGNLAEAEIIDRPTMSKRGIAMGMQWFAKKEEAIKRVVELKGNFIHNQGSFINHKFGIKWREPFTEGDKKALKEHLDLCNKYLIDVELGFGPRGDPPIQYSSDEEINLLCKKLDTLYELGFRNFCLNFDDLQNINQEKLILPEDIKTFKNMGEAHFNMLKKVYAYLKNKDKNIILRTIPLWYGDLNSMNEEQKNYLKKFGELPKDIEFICCLTNEKEITEEYVKLTKRVPFIWDNFFAAWEKHKKAPVFLPPLDRSNKLNDSNILGYLTLFLSPLQEDMAHTSWRSSFDYMWSPERYNPQNSLQRSVSKVIGSKGITQLSEYTNFIIDIDRYYLPQTDKDDRVKIVQEKLNKLNKWQENFKNILPPEIFLDINNEIKNYTDNLNLILDDQKNKPFPVFVGYSQDIPTIDGKLNDSCWKSAEKLDGFVRIKENLTKAKEQTEVKFLYDKNNLYLAITSMESQINNIVTTHTERDSNVFQDDSIEIFFDIEGKGENYFHIAINSKGVVYDAAHYDIGWFKESHPEFNGAYKIATDKNTDNWVIEMAIPLETFKIKKVEKGVKWNFNICRERYIEPKEFSSYSLLLKGGFHTPTRFWTLEFK